MKGQVKLVTSVLIEKHFSLGKEAIRLWQQELLGSRSINKC